MIMLKQIGETENWLKYSIVGDVGEWTKPLYVSKKSELAKYGILEVIPVEDSRFEGSTAILRGAKS